jgi:hypothetical protein
MSNNNEVIDTVKNPLQAEEKDDTVASVTEDQKDDTLASVTDDETNGNKEANTEVSVASVTEEQKDDTEVPVPSVIEEQVKKEADTEVASGTNVANTEVTDTDAIETTDNTEVFIEYNAPNTYKIVNKSTNKSFKLTRKEGECFVLQTDTKVAPVVSTNTTVVPEQGTPVVPEQKKKGMFGSFFGGKSITKKRRVTKKRNQKRGFKSRSKK